MRSVLVVALAALSTPAFAAFDAFLLYPGIPGEVVGTYAGHIELVSFEIDAFRIAENGSVASAGDPKLSDVKIEKITDIASPLMMLAAMNSTPSANQAEIKLVKAGGQTGPVEPYMTITLKRPVITSYALGGSSGDDVPEETVSISYDELCVTHRPDTGPGGALGTPVTRCWDATSGAPGSL